LAQCHVAHGRISGYGSIVVTNSSTGQELWSRVIDMGFARCTNIEFSHDSEKLAISYTDMEYKYDNITGIMIFSVNEGKMIDLIDGGSSSICCGVYGFDWSMDDENIFFIQTQVILYANNNPETTRINLHNFTFDNELNVILGCVSNDAINYDSLANRMNYVCDFGGSFSTVPGYGGGGYGGGTDVGWPALDFSGMGCFGWCPEELSKMDWIILISVCVVILFVVFKTLLIIVRLTKTTIKKYHEYQEFNESTKSDSEE